MGGFRAPVTLALEVPDGLKTASLSLEGAKLAVNQLAEVKAGSYTVTIKGASEGITRKAQVKLIVAQEDPEKVKAKEVNAVSPHTTKVTYTTTVRLKQATFIAPGKQESRENILPGDFSFTFDQDNLLEASLASIAPEIYLIAQVVEGKGEIGASLLVRIGTDHKGEKKTITKRITFRDYVYVLCEGIGASLTYDVSLREEYIKIAYKVPHKGKTIYVGRSEILVENITAAGAGFEDLADSSLLKHDYSEKPVSSSVSVFVPEEIIIARESLFRQFISQGWITPRTKGLAKVILVFNLPAGDCTIPETITEVKIE
jgi:uncharacterized protein YqfB (UPF0267 family)